MLKMEIYLVLIVALECRQIGEAASWPMRMRHNSPASCLFAIEIVEKIEE